MDVTEVDRIASGLTGVTARSRDGLTEWRYSGRLVARQLDPTHLVIRTDFGPRNQLVSRNPETFEVPTRYARHRMVVADLDSAKGDAIEDALTAAWALQAGQG